MDRTGATAQKPPWDEYLASDVLKCLTPREMETLALIAEGHDNASISRIMTIGPKSVENYNNHIYEKLGLEGNGGRYKRVQASLIYHNAIGNPTITLATMKYSSAAMELQRARHNLDAARAAFEEAQEDLNQVIAS